jgi:uncharacterized protein (DUF427 family)
MARAIWNDTVIAESDVTEMVEGNHYFPPDAIHSEYFVESHTTSQCPWKGTAHYYTVRVGDAVNEDAAWYYPQASERAKNIENYIAFWKGVKVED